MTKVDRFVILQPIFVLTEGPEPTSDFTCRRSLARYLAVRAMFLYPAPVRGVGPPAKDYRA